MDWLKDVSFWTFVIMILGLAINWLASHKIANNHLVHIDEKLDKIEGKVDEVIEKQNQHAIDIAVLQSQKLVNRKRKSK